MEVDNLKVYTDWCEMQSAPHEGTARYVIL
jgi:hypothetical protein